MKTYNPNRRKPQRFPQRIGTHWLDVPAIYRKGQRKRILIDQNHYTKLVTDQPYYTVWRNVLDTGNCPLYLFKEKSLRKCQPAHYTVLQGQAQVVAYAKKIVKRVNELGERIFAKHTRMIENRKKSAEVLDKGFKEHIIEFQTEESREDDQAGISKDADQAV